MASYGAIPVRTAEAPSESSRSSATALKMESPVEYKSELESFTKLMAARTTMLDMADGNDVDQEGKGFECCWKALNPALASTKVASRVGPNGWGAKADADGYVKHYENALGAVPDWVFTGTADHDWKSYDDVYNQDWFKNTYPSGESGI